MMRLSICFILTLAWITLEADETWQVVGTIESVSADKPQLHLLHEGIEGFAEEGGQLEVNVSKGDHAIAEVGRRIRGTLSRKEDALLFHTIWPADEKIDRTMTVINRDLTRPRLGRLNKGLLKIGDDLPRFALYNQKAKLVTPADWENKLVVLNFIFTRSRVPTMSAAATQRMSELQARLKEEGHGDSVRLISLSLDPEYDTPGVCFSYLEERGVDHDSFWLLSGSKKILEYLTKEIGVVSTPSKKTILNHSMVTLIVDREGKIFYRRPGSRWNVDDLYGRLEILLSARK
ncbi:MAG: SCO family protein [Verrucomicrobia bacterium]|nr:SCO family protein [Verrucomicrobiota bacterium]